MTAMASQKMIVWKPVAIGVIVEVKHSLSNAFLIQIAHHTNTVRQDHGDMVALLSQQY